MSHRTSLLIQYNTFAEGLPQLCIDYNTEMM